MEPMLALGFGYGLVLFRAAALCMTVPILGSNTVPQRIRLGIAVLLAFAAFGASGSHAVPMPSSFLALVCAAATETAIGLTAGFAARAALEAASAAGHLAGIGMGIGYGALLDPVAGVEVPVLANLFSIAALGCAVALGLHREAVLWLCRSLHTMPAGAPIDLRVLATRTLAQIIDAAALGLRLGLPFLGAVTIGHLALGAIGRTTPQLSLQSLGFGVAIVFGGAALWFFAPQAALYAAGAAVATLSR